MSVTTVLILYAKGHFGGHSKDCRDDIRKIVAEYCALDEDHVNLREIIPLLAEDVFTCLAKGPRREIHDFFRDLVDPFMIGKMDGHVKDSEGNPIGVYSDFILMRLIGKAAIIDPKYMDEKELKDSMEWVKNSPIDFKDKRYLPKRKPATASTEQTAQPQPA